MQTKRTLLLIALGLILGRLATDVPPVKAQSSSSCSSQTLSTPYTYALNGHYYDNNGYDYYYTASGVLTPDGNGNFAGTETLSNDGTISRGRKYTGTYIVNPDCTGSFAFLNSNGSTYLGMDIVITNSGKNVNLIGTGSGTNFTGTAQQQFPPVTTTSTSSVQ